MDVSVPERGSTSRIPPPATPEKGTKPSGECPTLVFALVFKSAVHAVAVWTLKATPPMDQLQLPLACFCPAFAFLCVTVTVVERVAFEYRFSFPAFCVSPPPPRRVHPPRRVGACLSRAVKVHFKPIANAPILRKSKFQVNSAWTCSEVRGMTDDQPLGSRRHCGLRFMRRTMEHSTCYSSSDE